MSFSSNFQYQNKKMALEDLKSFSGMHGSTDVPIYLHNFGTHYQLDSKPNSGFVVAIGFNGRVFIPE